MWILIILIISVIIIYYLQKYSTLNKMNRAYSNVSFLTEQLKKIIIEHTHEEILPTEEKMLFLYNLYSYRQLMSLKYDKLFVDSTIRTICFKLEDELRHTTDGYMYNVFNAIGETAESSFKSAERAGKQSGFIGVAEHLLFSVFLLEKEFIEEELIYKIEEHFLKVMNLPLSEI